MRTIPTKTQVLEAAERCPQTKKALEILFPQDFEEEKPKWPEGYKKFGAFIWNGGLYWRKEIDHLLDHQYPCIRDDNEFCVPKGYRLARGGSLLSRFPDYIRKINFDTVSK